MFENLMRGDYMPHGHCFLWYPEIVWLHVISDLVIALAYFSIPAALILVMRRRRKMEYPLVVGLFAAFILLCGTTHIVDMWNIWHGNYGVEGLFKAATAMVSISTAVVVWRLIPTLTSLPSSEQWANRVAREKERAAEFARVNAELSRVNQELDAFSYAASHDLKAPLRQIQALTGMLRVDLKDTQLPHTANEDFARIENAAARMQRLVDDLLQLSRAANRELKTRAVNLDELIDEVLESHALAIEQSGAKIAVAQLPEVQGDRTLLNQILMNLIGNALKFTLPGKAPRIELSASKQSDHYLLQVRDEGRGIAADKLEEVFRPFSRLNGTECEGSGIGLATVRRALERMNGSIVVRSEEGRFTEFLIRLPLNRTSQSGPAVTRPDPIAAPA